MSVNLLTPDFIQSVDSTISDGTISTKSSSVGSDRSNNSIVRPFSGRGSSQGSANLSEGSVIVSDDFDLNTNAKEVIVNAKTKL